MTADRQLVAGTGVAHVAQPETDGIDAWLDLIETLEAICPELPRPHARRGRDFRL